LFNCGISVFDFGLDFATGAVVLDLGLVFVSVVIWCCGADGSLKPIEFEMPQEPEFFMGGGGLYSTGSDYLKFVRMFLNHGSLDGKTVLRPETVATMGQNQIGDVNVVVLKSVLPDSSLDAEFFPGMVKKWGLGFMINTETAPTGRSTGSLAWAGLANTYFWIDPTKVA
jgi:methyl acetate hydrolase